MDGLKIKIHELRKQIDGDIQSVKALKEHAEALVAQRNIELSIMHLEDAKMRLGKCLEDLGSELPAQFADKANS